MNVSSISVKELLERKKMDNITFQKMCFIHNSLDEGWTVKKKDSSYVFTKKNEQRKEVMEDSYLMHFIKSNMDLNKLLN
jgi:hypothetical protein